MKYLGLVVAGLLLTSAGAQTIDPSFNLTKSIQLSEDTISPSHIVEGTKTVYVLTDTTVYSINKSSDVVTQTAIDKDFKISILSHSLANADSLYELPASEMMGAKGGKGGAIAGVSTLGDTLAFTYAFTYTKKIGQNSVPAIHMFLAYFYNGKIAQVIEIEHGIVMSIDMPPYFINPGFFQMRTPTEGIFSISSLSEATPFLFSTYVVNKSGKLEMDRVLKPTIANGLINENPQLTMIGASQSYISLPFMGSTFSNEVWNDAKKAKMAIIPTEKTPELGIKLRLGEPIPPSFGIVDLIAVNDKEIKALILEEKKISLIHFAFGSSKVMNSKSVFTAPIEIENIPSIGLFSENQFYRFKDNTLHIYAH